MKKTDDERVGDATTALKIWLSSIVFWNEISKKVPGPQGDYDREKLHTYAQNGQELGRQWALAMQKHTDNRSNWQYVHDTFAHVSSPPWNRPRAPAPCNSPDACYASSAVLRGRNDARASRVLRRRHPRGG